MIDFWAEWCRTRSSPLKKFADLDEFKKVDFYTCDSEEQEPVAYECSIPGVSEEIVQMEGVDQIRMLDAQFCNASFGAEDR